MVIVKIALPVIITTGKAFINIYKKKKHEHKK